MARLTSILLVALFAAISTGGVTYLHESMEHLHRSKRSPGISLSATDNDHDESTCQLCATLHMPALASGFIPILIYLGLFVAFLTQISPPLVNQHRPLFIDCRGPPAM